MIFQVVYKDSNLYQIEFESEPKAEKSEHKLFLTPKNLLMLHDFLLKNQTFQFAFEKVQIELTQEPNFAQIDYKSCHLVNEKVWQQAELEDALHWLSTLGGAYSNLGDHSFDFAIKAGENAFKQMKVALRSDDPSVIFKCWLFVAMSQMQQKQLKKSKAIIQNVYDQVKSQEDQTLSKMCLGIWARLQHKWNNSHSNRMNI